MSQPHIDDTLMQRLARVAHAYEMPMGKMLAHVLTVSLDELEGKEDAYTIGTLHRRCPHCQPPVAIDD